jgi:uroporphyrinogen III methyltransferase / synthase
MADSAHTSKRSRGTIVIGSRLHQIEQVLRDSGFTVTTRPELVVQAPPAFTTLDEAIENLFGYDWLIFVNEDAVRFFLERLATRAHDVSELDSLRVCAIGEATAAVLDQSQVHVDAITTRVTTASVIEQIADYAGGRESLQRVNILIPQASIGRDYLKPELEEAGARADVVVAYQTVAPNEATRLAAVHSLILTGSVDAVAFADENDIHEFARLFDTNDVGRLLRNVAVFLSNDRTGIVAAEMGVATALTSESSSQDDIVAALMSRFAI